ncbi:hypothetical protein DH2020_012624 [Rehmannia glutinosa]|uniref:Gamma-secretase subunit PEN-2 n=1 Tax=Rehmannia glutinosa TaxID=99300 RepID=A0ABR0X3R8_REHGL
MDDDSRNPPADSYTNPTAAAAPTSILPTTTTTEDTSSSRRRFGRAEWPTIDGPLGLSHEDSLPYARRFFKLGFLCLPFLWAVNCFYFWPVLRHPNSHHSHPDLRRCIERISCSMFVSTDDVIAHIDNLEILDFLAIHIFEILKRRLLSADLFGSAIGFLLFTAILSSWALTFGIGGERLFGHVWQELVMYNVADKYGLTGWM